MLEGTFTAMHVFHHCHDKLVHAQRTIEEETTKEGGGRVKGRESEVIRGPSVLEREKQPIRRHCNV